MASVADTALNHHSLTPLTIKHLLIECLQFNDVRQIFYQFPSLQDFFKNVYKSPGREHQNVFKFLGEGKLNRGREFKNLSLVPFYRRLGVICHSIVNMVELEHLRQSEPSFHLCLHQSEPSFHLCLRQSEPSFYLCLHQSEPSFHLCLRQSEPSFHLCLLYHVAQRTSENFPTLVFGYTVDKSHWGYVISDK